MRNVFTMVYMTVGYLGALQYIQCATTMVCLTVGGHRPPEASLTHSCVTVCCAANLSRGYPDDTQLYDQPLHGLSRQRLFLSELPLRRLPRTLVV